MGSDCRVSFVVTSRNDDHGGDMLRRFRIFAEGLLNLANRHRLSGELIVVEWNPPPGPRLHEVLKPQVQSDIFAVRFIEVPQEAHSQIRNSDVIPLFQLIAKNVGIRRARGEIVIATNPDLLFSDSLIRFLATGELRRDMMYRIDRYDVLSRVPENATVDEQLAWCVANVLRVHRKRGSFPVRRRVRLGVALLGVMHLGWRGVLGAYARIRRGVRRVRRGVSFLGVMHLCWRGVRGAYARILGVMDLCRRGVRRACWELLRLTDPFSQVHTNGCGDFTMMARDHWFALRGYPELPLWSMHVDSLLCYTAVASGLRECVLRPPAKIFHLEHQRSWVVMTPEQRLRTFALKPWIDMGLLGELWGYMSSTRRPVEFNPESWGLAEWSLKEVLLLSGEYRSTTSQAVLPATGR